MQLFTLLEEYALESKLPPAPNFPFSKLGSSLSLFHGCLLESNLGSESCGKNRIITDPPSAIVPSLLSRFIVCCLPNQGLIDPSQINETLFDIYSFFQWLERKKISHGLAGLDFQKAVKTIQAQKVRCQKLQTVLETITVDYLETPPSIFETLDDIFTVTKTDSVAVYLAATKVKGLLRLPVPKGFLNDIRIEDRLSLILGNGLEQWHVIEVEEIYPGYPS